MIPISLGIKDILNNLTPILQKIKGILSLQSPLFLWLCGHFSCHTPNQGESRTFINQKTPVLNSKENFEFCPHFKGILLPKHISRTILLQDTPNFKTLGQIMSWTFWGEHCLKNTRNWNHHAFPMGCSTQGPGSGSSADLSRLLCLYMPAEALIRKWLFTACCVEPHTRPHGSESEIRISRIRFHCPCGAPQCRWRVNTLGLFPLLMKGVGRSLQLGLPSCCQHI